LLSESERIKALVTRLRGDKYAGDFDVKLAADNLEFLQHVVDEIPALVEMVAADCGKSLEDRPSIYARGGLWRYHKVRASNTWADAETPLAAAQLVRSPV
jgi:hypothetical protein